LFYHKVDSLFEARAANRGIAAGRTLRDGDESMARKVGWQALRGLGLGVPSAGTSTGLSVNRYRHDDDS
jgi:hypothetical protein